MNTILSQASILRGARPSDPILEIKAAKIPYKQVAGSAIIFETNEKVTLESLEQCHAYLIAMPPGNDLAILIHSLRRLATLRLSAFFIEGMIKGGGPANSNFAMIGDKPSRWAGTANLLIYQAVQSQGDDSHLWLSNSGKYDLYMALVIPGETWQQLKVRLRSEDLAFSFEELRKAQEATYAY